MTGFEELLTQVASFCLAVLAIAMILSFVRLRKGPHLADRVLALDLMTTIVMCLSGVFAIYSRQAVYVDVTIVLALVSFVSTVIYAKLIEREAKGKGRLGGERP